MTIEDPSGRLIRWCIRLAEYDLEVSCKERTENNQDDALSRLHTNEEIVPDDNDDIATFSIHEYSEADDDLVDLLDKEDNADGFAKLEYTDVYESIAAMDKTVPNTSHFDPITIEELLLAELTDRFCAEIGRRLEKMEKQDFVVDDNTISIHTSDKSGQISAPHSPKELIL